MSREVLHLPEPAGTLLHSAFETLDGALTGIVPRGQRWRLGGGTVLAARWGHRKSTDIDIFLPGNSGITALEPHPPVARCRLLRASGRHPAVATPMDTRLPTTGDSMSS